MRALTKAVATDVAASSSMNLRMWRKDRMWYADALQMLSTCSCQTTVDRHTETLHACSCADSCLSERHGWDPVLTPQPRTSSEKDCFRLLRIKRQSVLGEPRMNSVSTILQSFQWIRLCPVRCTIEYHRHTEDGWRWLKMAEDGWHRWWSTSLDYNIHATWSLYEKKFFIYFFI